MKRTAMPAGKGFKPRAKFLRAASRSKPASSAGVLRVDAVQRERKSKPMKSSGMKGRAPTPAEQAFMDAVAKVGCLPCRKDRRENLHVSIHHIDGRTKEGAHFKVLALCAQHHQQDDSDPLQRISVHGAKKPFEARYGTQRELLAECIEIISGDSAVAPALPPKQISLEQ